MIKYPYTALLFILLILISCREEEKIATPDSINKSLEHHRKSFKEQRVGIDSLMTSYQQEPHQKTISANKPTVVTGNSGIRIHIDPYNLTTENGTLGDSITISLVEATKFHEMIAHHLQTVSDSRPLISGGMFHIAMYSDGKPLSIKAGRSLEVDLPKSNMPEMELFFGHRDSTNQMNWKPSDKQLQNRPKPTKPQTEEVPAIMSDSDIDRVLDYTNKGLSPQEKRKWDSEQRLFNQVYRSIELTELGWVNIDKYLKENNVSEVTVNINKKLTTVLYVVQRDSSMLFSRYYYPDTDKPWVTFTLPIPLQYQLLAISIDRDTVYSATMEVDPNLNSTIQLSLEQTETDDLRQLIEGFK